MQSTSHLDWLQVTFPADFSIKELVPFCGAWTPIAGHAKGYKQGFRSECGSRASLGGSETMGVNWLSAGDALSAIRDHRTDRSLMEFTDEFRGRASRIDLTVNLFNPSITVADVVAAWRNGELSTPAKFGQEDIGVKAPGHTLYIGSPKSDRRVRVYDKYAEMAIKDHTAFDALKSKLDSWLRFEIQSRDDRARAYQGALVYNPTDQVIKSAMRDVIQWDDQVYNEAMTGEDCDIPEVPNKPPKLWEWMQKQVVPALAKHQLENPDIRVGFIINLMLEDQLKRMPGIATCDTS